MIEHKKQETMMSYVYNWFGRGKPLRRNSYSLDKNLEEFNRKQTHNNPPYRPKEKEETQEVGMLRLWV